MSDRQLKLLFSSFAVSLVTSMLVLLVYWQINETQLAGYDRQTKQLAGQAAEFREAAEALRAEAESAKRFHVNAPYIVEGYRVGRAAKTAILEHRLSWGEFPDSLAEAGLDSFELVEGTLLTRIDTEGEGVITLYFDERSGVDGGKIFLVPERVGGLWHFRWRCQTSSYEHISAIIPECQFISEAPVYRE